MIGINPFKSNTNSTLVDDTFDTSYEVVKKVYCELDNLQKLSNQIPDVLKQMELLEQINQVRTQIEAIGNNIDAVLNVPQYVEEVKQTTANSIVELRKETLTLNNHLQMSTDDHIEELNKVANSAMFSFRYYDDMLKADQIGKFLWLRPTEHLKVGDHVVTRLGEVYQVVEVFEDTFRVGKLLTTIRGKDGLEGKPGAGLNIKGSYSTIDYFLIEHPTGEIGDAYFIGTVNPGSQDPEDLDHVFFWDSTAQSWVDAGHIWGVKGDKGDGLKDDYMEPDPTFNFNKYYKG